MTLRILFTLILNTFKLLRHQRDESTEKTWAEKPGEEKGTEKGTLLLQAFLKKAQCK